MKSRVVFDALRDRKARKRHWSLVEAFPGWDDRGGHMLFVSRDDRRLIVEFQSDGAVRTFELLTPDGRCITPVMGHRLYRQGWRKVQAPRTDKRGQVLTILATNVLAVRGRWNRRK